MMTPIKFGRPIKKEDADILFDRYMDIKQRSADAIKNALGNDKEAIRFYCGREEFGVKDDLAFIFDKASLIPVIKNILEGKADGFVLFNGARAMEDSLNEEGKYTDYTGRPTLMIFPYKEDPSDKNGDGENAIINLLNDGEEHPGTGGSTDPGLDKPASVTVPIPARFLPGEVHGIF